MSALPPTRVLQRDGRVTSIEYARCALVVARGADAGKRVVIETSKVTVGTAPGCQLVLTDPAVSRVHCQIEVTPDGFVLRDLGSTNGVIAGGMRIRDAVVEPGMRFTLGDSELLLEPATERAEIRLAVEERFGGVIGRSVAMREIFFLLSRLAPKPVTVLLTGETGTGKEVVARALHDESPRKDGPFIVVDCGSLPENLIEAELFGHAKAAFTGAVGERRGAFEEASGGTIFLDEIGELPLGQQAKLLRVLEGREVKRLGENTTRPVDVRVIAATNRALADEAEQGTFRRDLFFRLSVVEVKIPPLRARREDVALLAEHFLKDSATRGIGARATLTPSALRALESHSWPGNVRELRNVLEKAVALAEKGEIGSELIGLSTLSGPPAAAAGGPDGSETYADAHDRFERAYLLALLKRHGMNVTRAGQAAGIHRQTIHRLARKHGLVIDDLR